MNDFSICLMALRDLMKTGLQTETFNQFNSAMQMIRGFHVNGNDIRSRLGECFNIYLDFQSSDEHQREFCYFS